VTKIAVIYYSSTGNAYTVAQAIEAGARSVGAEVRLRKVRELAPDEAIASNKGWEQHRVATQHVAEAALADLEWADGFAFGTPTRFGAMSAQLKQFLDTSGTLWMKGLLADKAATAFVGASYPHGGQETTLMTIYNMMYHWGAIIVPPSYTDPSIGKAGGNPYGTSYTDPRGGELPAEILAAARYQGMRLARYATVLADNRAALRGT
jgi:NAD(P)H dehydrogenase (quinone)